MLCAVMLRALLTPHTLQGRRVGTLAVFMDEDPVPLLAMPLTLSRVLPYLSEGEVLAVSNRSPPPPRWLLMAGLRRALLPRLVACGRNTTF